LHDWEFEPSKDNPDCMVIVDKETDEEREHNRKVFARADEIEEEEWKLIWRIIQGQDRSAYGQFYQKIKGTEGSENAWNDWFDGSGMKHWWD